MAHDVFISYAIEDQRVADAVCKALEEEGVRCWYAPRDIPPGVDYEGSIIKAIRASKLMVLVLSSHANNSVHVLREVRNAYREELQLPVLPFQVEDITPNEHLSYYISSVHRLNASTPPLEAHLQRLVDYVQARLPQDEQVRLLDEEERIEDEAEEADNHAGVNNAGATSLPEGRRKYKLIYVALGALALAVVLGGLFAYLNRIDRGRGTPSGAGNKETGAASPSSTMPIIENENSNNAPTPKQNSNNSSGGNTGNGNRGNSNIRPRNPKEDGEAKRQQRAIDAVDEAERQQRANKAAVDKKPVKKPTP